MKYTRQQVASMFDISIDAIQHYEEIGLICIDKDGKDECELYSDKNILKVLLIKKFKALGLSIDEITSIMNEEMETNHTQLLNLHLHRLENKKAEIECLISYIHIVKGYFLDGIEHINEVRLQPIHEFAYFLFSDEEIQHDFIKQSLAELPGNNFLVTIDYQTYQKQGQPVSQLCCELPADFVLANKENTCIHHHPGGVCLTYTVFVPDVFAIPNEAIEKLESYANKHHFTLHSQILGSIMGPETINGTLGYFMALFVTFS